MNWVRILAMKMRAMISRRRVEREFDEELRGHYEMLVEQNLQRGMSNEEAQRMARKQLGGADQIKEAVHHQRGLPLLDSIVADVRYAVRMLRRSPGFTAVAVLTLALGIGANTAIFTVAYNVLLRPLPYRDAKRLVIVWEDASAYGFPRDTPAPGNYASWRSENNVFADMAAVDVQRFDLGRRGAPEQFLGEQITANIFPLLGVKPALGRNILPEEDKPGANHVVILSHAAWMANFGGDPNIIGKQIRLNDFTYTIIGVMPSGFVFSDRETQIWTPMGFSDKDLANHGSHYLHVIARLKDGVSLRQANGDLAIIAQRLVKQFPDSNTKVGAFATPLRNYLAGDSRFAALLLLGAVGFVLLIACANVANLLLARAAGRQKELAMRMALGAGRGRIIRQLVTESIALSVLSGCAGMVLAVWGTRFLADLVPSGLAPVEGSGINLEVLAFLAGVSILCGVLFGLAPVLHTARLDLVAPTKGSGRSTAGTRMNDILVVAEVALALVLFSGATLMVRSFLNVRNLDPGFRPEHVLALRTQLPFPKYQDPARRNAFFKQVLDRVNHLRGVIAAGCTTWLPLTNYGGATGIIIEGRPAPRPGQAIVPNTRMISAKYIEAIGMKLVRGRTFDDSDAENTPLVALINQAAAEKLWPGENPIGMRFKRDDSGPQPWITIVGVVGNVRDAGLDQPARATIYMPYDQHDFFAPDYLAIRTSGDPAALADAVREQVWAVDGEQPVTNVMPLEQMLEDYLAPRKLQSSLLGSFASFALLLAALGLYGLLAFSVSQRTQEFGVRVALGARPAGILRSVLAQGLKLAAVGVVIGVCGALALSHALDTLLFGVSATDLVSLAGAVVVLLAATAVACYIPAQRAMRVDPMVALRHE
jgi:putative ABC transport system permease protein